MPSSVSGLARALLSGCHRLGRDLGGLIVAQVAAADEQQRKHCPRERETAAGEKDSREAVDETFARGVNDRCGRADREAAGRDRLCETAGLVGARARVPDPGDGRAKLVVPTPRGREVLILVGRQIFADLEREWAEVIGEDRVAALRETLEEIHALQTAPLQTAQERGARGISLVRRTSDRPSRRAVRALGRQGERPSPTAPHRAA
jgi:hypothetical protein